MEVVAKFLTEEWSYEALTACAAVYRMCAAPCPFPCIEYPAQTDNTQIKSSRQIDLTKVSQYCHSCLCLYCIGLPHHNVFNPAKALREYLVHHTFGQAPRTRRTSLSLIPLRHSAVQLKTVRCNAVQRTVTQGNVR